MFDEIIKEMVRKGHFPEVEEFADVGTVMGADNMAMAEEMCNGPRCNICIWNICVHCAGRIGSFTIPTCKEEQRYFCREEQ